MNMTDQPTIPAPSGQLRVMEDWSKLISFDASVLKPTSIDALMAILEQVQRGTVGNGHIRVCGSMHSCAKIVASDVVLDTSALPTSITFDADNGGVVATANVTLRELLDAASKVGKSLTATGGTDAQTLAGLISTNTAPASSKYSIYDCLDWVELVSVDPASGSARTRCICRGSVDFPAAVCSLGALGVITRVRFRLVDERYFQVEQWVRPLTEVLSDLDATVAKYDFWRIDWLPKSQNGLFWGAKEVPGAQSSPTGDYPTDRAEQVLELVSKTLERMRATHPKARIFTAGPLLTETLEIVYHLLSIMYWSSPVSGPLRNMIPVDRNAPLHVAMAEWSFAPADLDRVRAACEDYFDRERWPNLPIEIELTPVDPNLMSPWNWEKLPYIVKFNFMYLTELCPEPADKAAIYDHLRGLWDHLKAAKVPFKAHWGKINFIDPEFVELNHDLDAFRPLISPMFMNDYLTERLGPVPPLPAAPA